MSLTDPLRRGTVIRHEEFEQYPLGEEVLGDALDFLAEEETYSFLTVEGKIASLRLTDVVVLKVT